VRLVALSDVAEMLGGVSRTRATEITGRATFPAPIDTVASGKVRVWDRAAVEAWIKKYRPSQRADEE
jgi:predicted DNA-binding transcriptional regulator AlpA